MGEIIRKHLELYLALRDIMGEPDFTDWFVAAFRDKLAEVKESRSNREPGFLHGIDTGDMSGAASFETTQRGRGGVR